MSSLSIPVLPSAPSVAWLFPGQGAQAVGMGRDLYDEIPAARAVFDAADEALGFALSTLCFDGPEEELTRTINTQPALVAHAIAALVAAVECGTLQEGPAYLAGHSLGEYAALIAAGAVSFEDGIRLVRERGRLMQDACDAQAGTMAAILGLDRDQVASICAEHGTSLCNENAPGNISIGGTIDAVRASSEAATAAGATRVVPLNVAGAFHTPLMQAAADGMRTVLAGTAFADPRTPVISNVDAGALTSAGQLAEELTRQITAPVLWVDGIRAMLAAGCTTFIEFGPGRVLTGALKRTERSAEVRNVGTAAEARGESGE
ncbi:MAG: ACP S-malonyltransferase [Dehalococcoidia bacterium]